MFRLKAKGICTKGKMKPNETILDAWIIFVDITNWTVDQV